MNQSITQKPRSNKLIIFLIFTFFFLVYITSSSGHFDPWDGTEYFLITESMVLKHSAEVYPDIPTLQNLSTHSSPVKPNFANTCFTCDAISKPTYLLRPLLTPAIAVPFYYTALLFSQTPGTVVAVFTNSFVMSLTCIVLFCFSLELYNSKKVAFVLTLIFGLCSFFWPYNNSLMSDPTTALCIFASAYFIYISTRNRDSSTINSSSTTISVRIQNKNNRPYLAALGALFLGLSLINHPTNILVIPGFFAYYIFSIRHNDDRKILLISFLIVLISVLLFAGYMNYARFGSFTKFGASAYAEAESLSTHAQWHGLVGLLFSPGKGLVFYFPLAILSPLALASMYAKNRGIFFICIYLIITFWLFFGTLYFSHSLLSESEIWSGGWWGPRYLLPLLPFITLTEGTLLKYLKGKRWRHFLTIAAFTVLSVAGFLVNLLGILVWWEYANNYADTYTVRTWDPYHSFIADHLSILKSDYISHVKPEKFSYTSYSLAPCGYDNYLYCKSGIQPILLMSTAIAIVGIIILIKIRTPNRQTRSLLIK